MLLLHMRWIWIRFGLVTEGFFVLLNIKLEIIDMKLFHFGLGF